jgi:hypothetical protein
MAIDMNEVHRTNRRIDELKDWVNKQFEKNEDRRRSVQTRIAMVLTIALYMALSYALGRVSAVSDPGAACESEHPTTIASPP